MLSYLFCSHKFHKITYYFIFLMLKKKIWSNFKKIIELFTKRIVNKLSKIWVWYPGSGDPEKTYSGYWIPDPGLKKAPDPGSGSATLIYYIYIVSICRFFFTRKFRCHCD
jgi:hypothetical protein